MFYGGRTRKTGAEDGLVEVVSDDLIESCGDCAEHAIDIDSPVPELAPPGPSPVERQVFLTTAVAPGLNLPSLPSILTKPPARPPIEAQDASPQHFGCPSSEYHGRRLPLVTVTNISPANIARIAKTGRYDVVNWSLPSGVSHERYRSAVEVPAEESPAISISPPTHITVPGPSPRATESKDRKTALLAHVRNWSDQVKASRRNSTSVPFAVKTPLSIALRRYSASPVLIASTKEPRLDLSDLLSSLTLDAQDTIAALDSDDTDDHLVVETENTGDTLYVLGPDSNDKQEVAIPFTFSSSKSGNLTLISSISASRSMTALASVSSRSLTDLLAAFDDVIAGPSWRRLLSRSDGIARRNDEIV